jgi:thioredoxin 1
MITNKSRLFTRKTTIIVSIGLVFILFIVAGFYILNTQNNPKNNSNNDNILKQTEITVDTSTDKVISETVAINQNLESDPNTKTKFEGEAIVPANPVPESPETKKVIFESGFINYDESKLVNAKYGRVVLFFHAAWCPSCRSLESDIRKNQNQIPNDLLIMKIDYDSNPELKKKYQIVQQHTLVKVDEEGKSLQTNKGLYQLNTLESVIKNF